MTKHTEKINLLSKEEIISELLPLNKASIAFLMSMPCASCPDPGEVSSHLPL